MGLELGSMAEWFGAAGTIGAVLTALFLEYVRLKRQRPRLRLSFDNAVGSHDRVLVAVGEDPGLYYRLRVHAQAGWDTARDVQVLLDIDRPTGAAQSRVTPSRNLKWSDVPDDRLDIPSGIWRRADLFCLMRSVEDRCISLVPMLKTYTEPWPPPYRHYCPDAGIYVFHLALVADNADSSRWTVSFSYDPPRELDAVHVYEAVQNLRVTEVPRGR